MPARVHVRVADGHPGERLHGGGLPPRTHQPDQAHTWPKATISTKHTAQLNYSMIESVLNSSSSDGKNSRIRITLKKNNMYHFIIIICVDLDEKCPPRQCGLRK